MTVLVVMIAVIVTLGIFLSFVLSTFSGSGNPDRIVLPSSSDEAISSQNQALVQKAEITPANVQDVIASLSRPESCSFTATVTYFEGESASLSYSSAHRVHDGYTRTERYDQNGRLSETVITGDGKIVLWEQSSSKYYVGYQGASDADSILRIPTYEEVCTRDASDILHASFSAYNDQNCIYVEAFDKVTGFTDEYWISIDNGLLIASMTASPDEVKNYEMQLSALNFTSPSEDFWLLPDGNDVRTIEPDSIT